MLKRKWSLDDTIVKASASEDDVKQAQEILREHIAEKEAKIKEYKDKITELENDIPYEEQNQKKSFFLSSLSVDETRISALIICLILSFLFGGYNYIVAGDITANLANIITTLIYAIAGVNITNSVINKLNSNKEEKTANNVNSIVKK